MDKKVLFVVRGEKNSEKALKLAPINLKIIDIAKTSEVIPDFVDGVPILANYETKKAYKGSVCLEKLSTEAQPGIAPAGPARSGRLTLGTFNNGSAVHHELTPHSGDSEELKIIEGRVKETDVNAYMQQRSQVTDAAVAKAKSGNSTNVPVGANRIPPSIYPAKK